MGKLFKYENYYGEIENEENVVDIMVSGIKNYLKSNNSKSSCNNLFSSYLLKIFQDIVINGNAPNDIYNYQQIENKIIKNLSEQTDNFDKIINVDKHTLTNKNEKINNTFAKEIAKLDTEKYCNLINNIASYAKNLSDNGGILDKNHFKEQIDAIEKAKSKRGFLRKIKEFFNGTRSRENKLIEDVKKAIDTNFASIKKEESLNREKTIQKEIEIETIKKMRAILFASDIIEYNDLAKMSDEEVKEKIKDSEINIDDARYDNSIEAYEKYENFILKESLNDEFNKKIDTINENNKSNIEEKDSILDIENDLDL